MKDFIDDDFDFINLPKTLPVVGAASGQEGLALRRLKRMLSLGRILGVFSTQKESWFLNLIQVLRKERPLKVRRML